MKALLFIFAAGLVLESAFSGSAIAQSSPIEVGGRLELFADRHLIDSLDGVSLQLQHPVDAGPVMPFDQPWEGLFSAYVTVIRDGELLRLYYRGHATDSGDGADDEVACYAESHDGTHWTRPALGRFSFRGSKENNIVLAQAAPVTHNFCPFLDTNPACPPEQRFKAIGGTVDSGLVAYVSANGLDWTPMRSEPVFRDKGWVFDSQNVAFWSPAENTYVLYYRRASQRMRAIARTTSEDFLNWSAPVQMTFSNTGSTAPRHQLYTNQTQPYFRAPHLLIATPARFMPGRRVLTSQQAKEIDVHPDYFGDTSDALFMTSRGGTEYDCTFEEGFVRPGLGLSNWVSRTNYPALNVVQTGPAEMSLFVNQDYGQPTAHLHRYTLRLDGFASVHAGAATGTLLTKPLRFSGDKLLLNFSTSAAGGIKVELLNEAGSPLPGYSLSDCEEMIGNDLARAVTWTGQGDSVAALAGQIFRIRFQLTDADLFALQFANAASPPAE